MPPAEGLRTIAQFDPDVVIAVDDEAQEYVMRRFAGKARPKVVFAAIDHEPAEYGYVGAANVTGVAEGLPLAAIRDLLHYVKKGQPVRLAVLSDTSPTGQGAGQAAGSLRLGAAQRGERAYTGRLRRLAGGRQGHGGQGRRGADAVPRQAAGRARRDRRRAGGRTHTLDEAHAAPLPLGTDIGYVQQGGGSAWRRRPNPWEKPPRPTRWAG